MIKSTSFLVSSTDNKDMLGVTWKYTAVERMSSGVMIDALVQLAEGVTSNSIVVGGMFDLVTFVVETAEPETGTGTGGGTSPPESEPEPETKTRARAMRGRITSVTFVSPPSDEANRDMVAIKMESSIRLLGRYNLFKTYSPANSFVVLREMVTATVGEQSVGVGGNFSSRERFPGASRYLIQAGENCWVFAQRVLSDDGTSFVVINKKDGSEMVAVGDGYAFTTRETPIIPATSGLEGVDDFLLRRLYRYGKEAFGSEYYYSYIDGIVNNIGPSTPTTPTGGTAERRVSGVTAFTQSLTNGDELKRRSKVMLDAHKARTWKIKMYSIDPSIQPGLGLTIGVGHEIDGRSTLIVDEVVHSFNAGRYVNKGSYRDGSVAWGPTPMQESGSAMTVIARVHGGEAAADGDYVSVDRYGHLPVIFPWDGDRVFGNGSSDTEAESARRVWLRASQLMAGNEHGSTFKPRHGEEVLVQLVQGSPDSAVILGRLYYHGNHMPELLQHSSAGMVFTLDDSDANKFTGVVFKRLESDKNPDPVPPPPPPEPPTNEASTSDTTST